MAISIGSTSSLNANVLITVCPSTKNRDFQWEIMLQLEFFFLLVYRYERRVSC